MDEAAALGRAERIIELVDADIAALGTEVRGSLECQRSVYLIGAAWSGIGGLDAEERGAVRLALVMVLSELDELDGR
jgi:hypothetical protein